MQLNCRPTEQHQQVQLNADQHLARIEVFNSLAVTAPQIEMDRLRYDRRYNMSGKCCHKCCLKRRNDKNFITFISLHIYVVFKKEFDYLTFPALEILREVFLFFDFLLMLNLTTD